MTLCVVAALAGWLITDDVLVSASILVLGVIWVGLRAEEGPPVVAMAVTFQWIQVTVGLFYVELTGRPLPAMLTSDYRPMVAIGLGCVVVLVAGLWCGQKLVNRSDTPQGERPDHALAFPWLLCCYGIAVVAVGGLREIAWNYPSFTQAIIAVSYIRFGLLYLVFRRFVQSGRWDLMAALVAFEVALGFTGFFAGFREPLIMAMLACLEVFDRHSVRHWLGVATLAVLMCGLGAMWMTVRETYRDRFLHDESFAGSLSKRFDTMRELASGWAARDSRDLASSADQFVDRLWAVYYPALAVARVPRVVPHTNGELMWTTIRYLATPRIFFPEKSALASESELVRRYSGIWVAGEKEQTNIAFGYAAESYVDFGVPLMFVPVWLYGVLVGTVCSGMLRVVHHRDLAVSVVTVIGWLSLYLFERSWTKTIGLAATLVIYVGALTILLDQLWLPDRDAVDAKEETAFDFGNS
jgi:hypothetical protein